MAKILLFKTWKRMLISLIITMSVFSANAENIEEEVLSSDRNHWTATVSYDLSIPGNWKVADRSIKMFKAGSGVSAGADYMLLLGKGLFFEPGVRFFIDSYKYDDITIGDGTVENPWRAFDPSVRKIGLRIPLTIGYKWDVFKRGSLFLSTGPEPIIGFSAKIDVDDTYEDIFDKNLYNSWMRRWDIAWDVRAAVIIDRFRVDLTGAFGLLDINKESASMHEYRFSIGLGYVF